MLGLNNVQAIMKYHIQDAAQVTFDLRQYIFDKEGGIFVYGHNPLNTLVLNAADNFLRRMKR